MLTFAITTTTKLAGISLHRNNKMLGEIRIEVSKTHSTTILDQIDSLFTWTGEKLDNVENVLVSIGPGSFTGVRIAISVVKGMFYGKNVNFYQVNELDALAYQVFYSLDNSFLLQHDEDNEKDKLKIYSMIDSGKEKIYYASYGLKTVKEEKKLKQMENYEVIKLEKLMEKLNNEDKKIVLIGDAGINYREKIMKTVKNKMLFPADDRMRISTATFMQMFLNNILKKSDIFQLKPDYLEKSQAERDKK
jgi:universal bacterial protein yeaZ